MSTKRAPMTPPELPGFTYIELLGSGGFADVYLYEQHLPLRRVAVKVLLADRISASSVAEFTAEANVMAMLSTHPAIVTIYQAGVAADGRPYLVMEYCPRPNLQLRYRREPFSVAESLRVGIQVAAAVETAHRAGVLHRDIKPANILVTEYNRPALTDFGIASTSPVAAESAGLSIPWSPPESFADDPSSDARSDVYALGATVYSLLSGRSPFELPGQRNTGADLIQRIETMPVASLGRADTPASLQHALERAMSKAPADRYDSALAFARALQKVQIELSHSVTPIDILDDHVEGEIPADEDDGLTRVRGVVSINPETAPAAGETNRRAGDDDTVRSAASASGSPLPPAVPSGPDAVIHDGAPDLAATVRRAPAAGPPLLGAPPAATASGTGPAPSPDAAVLPPPAPLRRTPRGRSALWSAVAAVAAAAVIGVVIAVSLPGVLGGTGASPAPTAAETSDPMNPVAAGVQAPTDLAGTAAPEGVVFTWANPDPQQGDRYAWGLVTRADEEPQLQQVDEPTVTVPADPSGQTCIEVLIIRTSGQYSEPVRECTP